MSKKVAKPVKGETLTPEHIKVAVERIESDALIRDLVKELIQKLAKRGVTMGQFAALLEQSTGGRLVIDIRNRNDLLPLADMDATVSYPMRRKYGNTLTGV